MWMGSLPELSAALPPGTSHVVLLQEEGKTILAIDLLELGEAKLLRERSRPAHSVGIIRWPALSAV